MTEGHIDYDGWRRGMVSTIPWSSFPIKQKAQMTKWIYIETRMIDGWVSFAHVFVTAATEEEAYEKGCNALMDATHDNGDGLVPGDFLNDTVIELEND